jgi:hypothetical protein
MQPWVTGMQPWVTDMLPLMEIVCYRLWKWYVTAYGNGMLLPSNTNGYIFNYVTAHTKTIYRNG